jgi:hypothetical protein
MTERRTEGIATPGTGTTERRTEGIATPGTGTTETNPRNTSDAEKKGGQGTGISDGTKGVDSSVERSVGRQQGMTNQ